MALELTNANRLQVSKEELTSTKPVATAKALGFRTNEFGMRALPVEEPFPHVFLRLAYDAVRDRTWKGGCATR